MLTVRQRYRQTDRQTDGRTTYDSNTALALRASRGKKRGIEQRDGRPLVGQYRHLSNATDLLTPVLWTMAGGWIRTPVLLLAVCGPKYTKLSLPLRECLYFATPFSDWRYIVAFGRYSRSSREVDEILMFWASKFRRKGSPKFLTEFINLGHHRTCGKVLTTIGQVTSEIRRRKKEDLNDSRKTEWPTASIAGGRP